MHDAFKVIQTQQAEFMDACSQVRHPLFHFTAGKVEGITVEQKASAIAAMWLYRNLINEEVNKELIAEIDNFRAYMRATDDANMSIGQIARIADGCIDSVVVIMGLLNSMGIDGNEVWNAVHKANMAKLGPDGKAIKRPDGKILKPDGWSAADVIAIITEQLVAGRSSLAREDVESANGTPDSSGTYT